MMRKQKPLKWEKVPDVIGWNRVRALRKKRGWTQLQLAAGSGVSVATLTMIEAGMDQRTTDETKNKIAVFFGVNADDIFPSEMRGNVPVASLIQARTRADPS